MDVFNALCALTSRRSASRGTGERPLPIRSLPGFKAITRDGAETPSIKLAEHFAIWRPKSPSNAEGPMVRRLTPVQFAVRARSGADAGLLKLSQATTKCRVRI